MSNYNGEKVLVIAREKLELGNGLIFEKEEFAPEDLIFIDREIAEKSPEFKQIIPYCIIIQGHKTLSYTRGKVGQEARLHAKKSIGVGGHINPCDFEEGGGIRGAMLRELKEEIGISEEHIEYTTFVGWVNEDDSEVGNVHLGLVYLIGIRDGVDFLFENCLLEPEFLSPEKLVESCEDFETWSQFLIEDLKNGMD